MTTETKILRERETVKEGVGKKFTEYAEYIFVIFRLIALYQKKTI